MRVSYSIRMLVANALGYIVRLSTPVLVKLVTGSDLRPRQGRCLSNSEQIFLLVPWRVDLQLS